MARYTEAERRCALRLIRGGFDRDAVVDVIGCKRRTITRWAAAIGVDLRRGKGGPKQQITARTEAKILKLRAKRHSLRRIGELLGWSQTTVLRVLRRKGIP